MMCLDGARVGLMMLAFVTIPTAPVAAQLRADELLLVYNSDSKASRGLAEHYADVRQVPRERLLGLPTPMTESIGPAQYAPIAAAVRKFVTESPGGDRIRCLVTFRDVPLKIGAPTPTPAELARRKELLTVRERFKDRVHELLAEMERALGEKPRKPPGGAPKVEELVDRYRELRKLLAWRIQRRDAQTPSDLGARLVRFIERAEGTGAAVAIMRESLKRLSDTPGAGDDPRRAAELARIDRAEQAVTVALARLVELHDLGPMSPGYHEALNLLPGARGDLGALAWIDADIKRLAGTDCHAAFDSELSLVMWNAYSRYRWAPNLLNPEVAARSSRRNPPRTLMVSRIDAPTVKIARRMIDDAVAVESKGLMGTAYVDVRGLSSKDEYGVYDGDLMELYYLLRDKTKMPVRIDREAKVFPAGCCDDAALYCGWYSVSKYVPAFKFVRGAVGYHIASFELQTLRSKRKRLWCAGLLKDGVIATLGPTSEPYLGAFPKPSKFFALLLTGQYTLAECFYRTSPYNSWQIALLGDPLYRPFARKNVQKSKRQN